MSKLTRKQHLAMARCLRAAKKKLTSGDYLDKTYKTHRYVCRAVHDTKCLDSTKKLVTDWIDKQLGKRSYITDWAHMHVDIDFRVFKNRQAYRHAWVDHMIKVLES